MASQHKRADLKRTVPNPLPGQQFRGDPDYPAGKKDFVDGALDGADENVSEARERISDRRYDGPTAVPGEVGKVD